MELFLNKTKEKPRASLFLLQIFLKILIKLLTYTAMRVNIITERR
jgi:hypothetical protein|nr:MAG TPA: hypothetical protein [Caudoviricetes sp.]